MAYNVADYQVAGIPGDTGVGPSTFFEIDARVEGDGVPTMDEARLAVQALLAERFKLRVRRESREMPIYVLIATDDGPKLTPCSDPKTPSSYTPGRITSCNPPIPMARILQFLSMKQVDRLLTRQDWEHPHSSSAGCRRLRSHCQTRRLYCSPRFRNNWD